MARIELKYCTIRMRDGLKGSAVGPATAPVAGATTLSIGTVALNSLNPGLVPIGARFNIAGETSPLNHTVTGRTQGSGTGGANEVQSVTVQNATGGTFKLFWGSGQTTELAYDAAPTDIAAALAPLVGASGNIAVTGTPGSYTVTFQGSLANAPQPLLIADTSELIGTSATVAIAETTAGAPPTGSGQNEVQSVTVQNASGGTFSLVWGGCETAGIAYNAAADAVATALTAMASIGAGNVAVTGTAGSYTVTFQGTLAHAPQPLLVPVTSALTGSGAAVAVAEVAAGAAVTAGGGSTTSITFSPPLGAGTYAASAAITFKSQEVYVKIGEGNLTYTEHRDYTYLLDRGWLDTVRESKDVPMDVKVDAVYEHITNGTGEAVCPMDALKGVNSAAEWVSSSPDACEPYCVDVLCEYNPPCAPVNRETNVFPMFRAETREINYNAATIVLTGKCLAKEPTTYRGTDCDNV